MASDVSVTRETFLSGPPGEAVYVYSPTYARTGGRALLQTVRHEAFHERADSGRHYYSSWICRRRSEDNGATWREEPGGERATPADLTGAKTYPFGMVLHPQRDVLIDFESRYEMDSAQPMFGVGSRIARTYRLFYRVSRDGGLTWGEPAQAIDARPGYDAVRWAPGIEHGRVGGVGDGQRVFLPDGAMVMGFTLHQPAAPPEDVSERAKELYTTTRFAQARLSADAARLEWRFSDDEVRVPFPRAAGGCCESALAWLGGVRLYATMRCQGDERCGIFSSRQGVVSEDGGLTWSRPAPLAYDDGRPVWTPASLHQFVRSSKNGRTYLLANILDRPVFGQVPRYPLCLAEFDCDRLCVVRHTVQIVQGLPSGAPRDRRYTNWGLYEERGSGDVIVFLPEMPRAKNYADMKPEEYGADCVRYRLVLPD